MKIDPSYLSLNIHQRINARSGCLINRKTGLTPYGRQSRFSRELKMNNIFKDFYDQPFCLRKHIINQKQFIKDHNCKF